MRYSLQNFEPKCDQGLGYNFEFTGNRGLEKDVKQHQGDIISRIQTGGNATGKATQFLL